jgi:hypothetical protein
MTTKEQKALDRQIERVYGQRCHGIQIDIYDIGKVFAVGRMAAIEGRDIGDAIAAFVETIRKN